MNCKEESIHQVLDEYGASLPDEAIKDIIHALDMCDEYASYSTGGYNPQAEEIRNLNRELERERGKVVCGECKGRGRIITPGPYHSSDEQCFKCRGSGYLYVD
jgi:hypothetical protein